MTIRWVREDGTVCAPGAGSYDLALCGAAHEGEFPDLAAVVSEPETGAVTCHHCCEVIRHVREDLRRVKTEPMEGVE